MTHVENIHPLKSPTLEDLGIKEPVRSNNFSLMPEKDQTTNGDYEYINYHTFEAVDYDRSMSWEAGDGMVHVGVKVMKPQKTDVDNNNITLLEGQSVIVYRMKFKLAKKAVV